MRRCVELSRVNIVRKIMNQFNVDEMTAKNLSVSYKIYGVEHGFTINSYVRFCIEWDRVTKSIRNIYSL